MEKEFNRGAWYRSHDEMMGNDGKHKREYSESITVEFEVEVDLNLNSKHSLGFLMVFRRSFEKFC